MLGDKHGTCLYLGERECSIQRRNQKVIEEAPSPFLDAGDRGPRWASRRSRWRRRSTTASAGTVEFIVDGEPQLLLPRDEHPAAGRASGDRARHRARPRRADDPGGGRREAGASGRTDVRLDGWAIESRLYAEDPYRNFLPSIGRLTRYRPPEERRTPALAVRNDTGVFEGGEISMYYDPMIAKLCTWAPDRAGGDRGDADGARRVRGRGDRPQPAVPVGGDGPSALRRRATITTAFIAEEYPGGLPGRGAAGGDAAAGGGGGGGDAPGGGDPADAGVGADGQPRAQGRARTGW